VWLARGGALVTLLHRRADLHETMSDYLVRDLERYGVAVRDLSEIAQLHGQDGQLEPSPSQAGKACPSPTCSCSSAHVHAPTGSTRRSPATRTDSSSPPQRSVATTCWRRACQGSTRPAMSAPAPPRDAPRPLARERWSCSSFTPTSREQAQRSGTEVRHASHPPTFPPRANPPCTRGASK
jgi:hypothetical protein